MGSRNQEAGPGRARQPPTEGGEQEAISRPPAWPLDLAREEVQLVPVNRELKPEVGVGMAPCDQGLKEKTEDRVEEGARSTMSHRGRLTHLRSLIPRRQRWSPR